MKSCHGDPPPVLDPFAGGGSIPLEAQRLGLKVCASDLNPVAVLINKAIIEIPPKFVNQPPIHPEAGNRTPWLGAEGLIEDVRLYGEWIRDEAERRIGHLYPEATLADGSKAKVIAWIWARTVLCPNPACRVAMPLVRSFWLSKKKGKQAWVNPVVQNRSIRFTIEHDPRGPEIAYTVGRRGATCLCCKEPVQLAYIRSEGQSGRIGNSLIAIAAQGNRRRVYLPPNAMHESAANVPRPDTVPIGELPSQALGFRVQAYGMTEWSDLYTNRQATALCTFSDLVMEAHTAISKCASLVACDSSYAEAYADAVTLYLALIVGKLANRSCSLTRWIIGSECPGDLFSRHAIPMVWDFAETNVLSSSSGSWESLVNTHIVALKNRRFEFHRIYDGVAYQHDARSITRTAVIATDPPYYDNIGYADLSDFFYVWLRRSIREIYPELLSTILTPKIQELIATPFRHSRSKTAAAKYFEEGFVEVFTNFRHTAVDDFPLTLFYAFKQSEKSIEGTASTGWSTMLEGLISAGWTVTGTWPMRTERGARMIGQGSNALASSIVLACRPRPDDAAVTDRQGFLRALHSDMPAPIRRMQKAAIAPVDLRQAAIGPGMEVFSRYARVVKADGEPMRVHTALGLINRVLESVLGEAEADFDLETRWAVTWYSQYFEDESPYGIAEQLAVSMNVSVDGLVRSGILKSGGGKVRLLSRDEMPADWNPDNDDRIPIWEAVQHLTRSLLEDGYKEGAGPLLARLSGKVNLSACQALTYRLYDICEKARPNLAGPYNALAASWHEIRLEAARAPKPPPPVNVQQTLDAQ